MRFSVVVPAHNRLQALEACLEALVNVSPPAGGFEIIVIDDGSEPALLLPPVIPASIPTRLVRQANQGPAAARNLGAGLAKGRYLVFVDDDCQPEPGWLEGFDEAADDAVLLGGTTRNGLHDNPQARFNQHLIDAVIELSGGFFPSNNVCVAKEDFDALGGFSAAFLDPGGEDREFCARWAASGRKSRRASGARVRHYHGQTLGQFWRMHARYGAGAAAADNCERLNPVALARRTISKTGLGGVFLYAISQLATARGYYAQLIRHGVLYAGLVLALACLSIPLNVYGAEFGDSDEAAHVVSRANMPSGATILTGSNTCGEGSDCMGQNQAPSIGGPVAMAEIPDREVAGDNVLDRDGTFPAHEKWFGPLLAEWDPQARFGDVTIFKRPVE